MTLPKKKKKNTTNSYFLVIPQKYKQKYEKKKKSEKIYLITNINLVAGTYSVQRTNGMCKSASI